jgi:hypothetical protein
VEECGCWFDEVDGDGDVDDGSARRGSLSSRISSSCSFVEFVVTTISPRYRYRITPVFEKLFRQLNLKIKPLNQLRLEKN